MYLYNLTLQRATGVTMAVHGSFSGTKQQEIVVARGKILELLRPEPNTGKVYTMISVEVFGAIRSIMPFRLTGGSKGGYCQVVLYCFRLFCISHRANNIAKLSLHVNPVDGILCSKFYLSTKNYNYISYLILFSK